jgi:pimeloyl-ACP methyl ester carboxylesterase
MRSLSSLLTLTATLLAACVAIVPATAADRCEQFPSAAQDTADIRGVRAEIEVACPCAAFDGSVGKNRASFRKCAKTVVADASDGTPVNGHEMRPQCMRTLVRLVGQSDCGSAPAADRHPCCQHRLSGRTSGKIARGDRCTTTPSTTRNACPSFHFVADACSGNALNTCNTVGTTTSIASAAEPPNTPGTAGVTVTNAKLITQFEGSSFSLNNATYTRFRMDGAPTPDAILVLIPGFEGGAYDFKILAENLIPRVFLERGLVVEVWAFDRRSNQLEDRTGVLISQARLDPGIALDWYFGAELGLALDPVLAAGPNRRAVFYNSTDVPFIANWTPLVFARDIDAVVGAADAAVRNHNVFLGGHSMGTTFTARYASTDFNLTGVGPAEPGYANVRGLVLLEGAGGSTGGNPLSNDTLDRIEASFDGGLYGAVNDPSSPGRCADGITACTIANEGTSCVGQSPPKCTLTTTAYSLSSILNPRLLASSEPSAIQGAYDPDTGEGILAVDQGTAVKKCFGGANAFAACTANSECASGTCINSALVTVGDLAGLTLLPRATVEGGIGTFVDSNGFVASLAPFLAMSVGGAGPTVNGLLTWRDITEGIPASETPNLGPAPTSLPPPTWGKVQQVTSFTRLLDAFYVGNTNFSDWYYPNSGLSVTGVPGHCSNPAGGTCQPPLPAGRVGAPCGGVNFSQSLADSQCSEVISLDSTALSADPPIGRGRRDIENLTQAGNIDIPVISFVGSHGLARVPGALTAFGTSIHRCMAPSCDGTTDRVVDPVNPNPAFPTLGDVPGGFEVYVSEGYAHLDVLTAEDSPNNTVIGPLAAFLKRNTQ